MQESQALPFELTSDSVSDWLLALDRLFLTERINSLNGVLSALANAPIEKNTLFLILDRLTESVLLLSKLLEQHAERADYAPDKAGKWMTAALQLPKKLGFAFAKLAKHASLPDTQKVVCAYRALQLLSLVNKRSTLFHEAQDLGVWKKFAELYLLAETQNWLTLAVDDRVSGLMPQPTIDGAVKHALLFHGCHPYHYRASDIADIFAATAELAACVRLGPATADFSLCRWQPDTLLPPDRAAPDNAPPRLLSLDNGGLIDFFESHPDKQAKFAAYPGLLNRLTAYYEIRRSIDPLHAKKCDLIIGGVQAARFLNILISRYRVMELSGITPSRQKASHLELVPLEIKNTMASLSSKVLAGVNDVAARQLTIFDTEEPAFCVANIASRACSQDEPAIIAQEGQPPCFAVIRHIRVDSHTRLRNLLLERIEGGVYPVEIGKNQGFIVMRSEDERAELFLPPDCRHGNTTVLAIARGIIAASLKVEKFLELSAHFTRYQVSFC
ncbi:hypothetical protein [Methylomicrobium lacus]|uniref:hypothetical protein n=1 Tax=Methylomicrobium lacus TaxID=136992 RepID=UPI0035A92A4C